MKISVENSRLRAELYDYIQVQIDLSKQQSRKISLAVIKIQDLKYLEVNLGFPTLELISKSILARMLSNTKNHQLVIQRSLDELLVIIPKTLNKGHLKIVTEKLSREIQLAFEVGQENIELVHFIGVAAAEDSDHDGATLYKNALIALEKGKSQNVHQMVYQPDFSMEIKKTWDLKKNIEVAIYDNQFELFFQPKIEIKNRVVCGAEALIRWNHPGQGLVSPMEFIPVAEQSGQIHAITEWVVKSAIQQLSTILKIYPDFRLSINISADNLDSTDLMLLLEDTLSIWNVPAQNLIIEVTETTIMSDAQSSLHQLEKIRKIGVGVSIDDFGTGYSSLAYFKKIPATELKIDKSFIDNLLSSPEDKHIVSLIILLAKRFNLQIVAEGVETKEILDEVCVLQCDYIQGYYFSKPLCYSEFMNWVEQFEKGG